MLIGAGCTSGMRPKQFEGKSPRFVPEQYFAGKSHGTGAIFVPKRSIRYTFTVDLEGKQEGDLFNLYEDLRFSTGENFKRVYTFKKLDDHNYDMRCPDLKGPAKLESYGDTVKLTYSLKQTLDGKTITLHFDDWMFLQPDGVVLNRAYGTKFGLNAAELMMSIRKVDGSTTASSVTP